MTCRVEGRACPTSAREVKAENTNAGTGFGTTRGSSGFDLVMAEGGSRKTLAGAEEEGAVVEFSPVLPKSLVGH